MSWEVRDGRRYYYRAVRRKDRVVKEYIGIGPAADLSARLDASARRERELTSAWLRAERPRHDPAERSTRDFDMVLDLLLSASMYAAGFHRQRSGPWRKRRHERTAAVE